MTFSEIVKSEILKNKPENACCKMAFLSAFIRGAGTFVSQKGFIGVEILSENKDALSYACDVINSLYGITPKITLVRGTNKGKNKYKIEILNAKSFNVLKDLGFFEIIDGDVVVNMNIDRYLTENSCCKKYYVIGYFIGSGSVTIPKAKSKTVTSYHLEFVFSNYKTASDFSALITELGFLPKHVLRKDKSVVYFKSREEIGSILVFLGAKKGFFELESVIIERDITNETNRRVNCEMANIDKQISASETHINNINIIEQTVGLNSLPPQLKETANMRINHPDLTLTELATLQGVTKSCLNHRLRKIAEIAKNCTQ